MTPCCGRLELSVDVSWLTSEEGREAIAALADVDPLHARSRFPHLRPDQINAALSQARHRPPDFPLSLVTVDGVQQASPVAVAQRRAQRLAESGVTTVIDAGCGIGMDSWAFARAGLRVLAYELDPTTADVARANLAGLDVEVVTGDATASPLPPGALYVDPARRRTHQDAAGRPLRIRDPEQWRPAWSWVVDQARHRQVVARIRPGFRDVPEQAEWHCSSIGRRLVDATVWFPPLARTASRASVHDGGSWHELSTPVAQAAAGPVGRYVIDPDPAIVRAGLVTNAAHLADGHLLDPYLAFVTCDTTAPAWLGRCMEVVEQVHLKGIGTACRRRGWRTATLWARGFQRPPDIGVPPGNDAVVVAARLGASRSSVAWLGIPVH